LLFSKVMRCSILTYNFMGRGLKNSSMQDNLAQSRRCWVNFLGDPLRGKLIETTFILYPSEYRPQRFLA